ncbi:putative exonuclease [Cyphellophora attinorum]|uniref:Putative exonuclease n=1 Tax=Cyphellophora attinorum TaxID=1664694 RepID=A0A0N0NRQ8_9EURO|nr:putative exonuclease [Phialophora attinorum]KPI45381.1 putative exonuclease [Phialophora attinorum]
MARKRSHDDFGNDASLHRDESTDVRLAKAEWQEVRSKKKRRKEHRSNEVKVRQHTPESPEPEASTPSLRFGPSVGALHVDDLQSLILYILTKDAVAPKWVAVRNARAIKQVVTLMVPGIDRTMLEAVTEVVTKARSRTNGQAAVLDGKTNHHQVEQGQLRGLHQIKAPGNSKTGHFASPLQAMLLTSIPVSKRKNDQPKAGRSTRNGPTPLYEFIHTPEQLEEADFPLHPSLSTDPIDVELQATRRRQAAQSVKVDGWVDTVVESSTLPSAPGDSRDSSGPVAPVYALDCEMVVTDDDRHSLARVSIVNWDGITVLDELVKPSLPIKDYLTQYSGITEAKLKGVTTKLEDIQARLLKLFTPSTVIAGHSLDSDLNALKLTHPFIIDTTILYPHPNGLPSRSSLKYLTKKYLNRDIQKGGVAGHDSVEDALAVMDLVKLKCKMGPQFGSNESNQESIFARLSRSGHKTAMFDHGTYVGGVGRPANIKVGCKDDIEIVDALLRVLAPSHTDETITNTAASGRSVSEDGQDPMLTPPAFTFARLRALEFLDRRKPSPIATSSDSLPDDSTTEIAAKAETHKEILQHLLRMVEALISRSNSSEPILLIVYPGGPDPANKDLKDVHRLQAMHKQYQQEFKTKKWDQLSVQWTDRETQALRRAFEQARKGWGFVGLL